MWAIFLAVFLEVSIGGSFYSYWSMVLYTVDAHMLPDQQHKSCCHCHYYEVSWPICVRWDVKLKQWIYIYLLKWSFFKWTWISLFTSSTFSSREAWDICLDTTTNRVQVGTQVTDPNRGNSLCCYLYLIHCWTSEVKVEMWRSQPKSAFVGCGLNVQKFVGYGCGFVMRSKFISAIIATAFQLSLSYLKLNSYKQTSRE